ncbi:MAG: hypothetical protein IJW49_08280 [Clostridia bacterium]|nr:hypothetical protein [Clostridia bacterium]
MKRYGYKIACFLCLLSLSILFLSLSIVAEEANTEITYEQMPEEYGTWLDSIPEDVAELLPPEVFSDNAKESADAVMEMSSFSYLIQTLLKLIGAEIGDCVKVLATVCGLLLITAVCNALKTAFSSDGIGRAFGFCTTLVITLALMAQSYFCLEKVTQYFGNLNSVTAALLPLNGTLYAMGGNTSTAVASSAGLSVYMTVLEEIVGKSILPFCGICMAFALMGSIDSSLRTGGLLSTVKKNYTTALAFLMMLLLAMLAAQNTLGTRADSLAMRSVRFAATNWIPVVGGSVAEVFRTISAGVGYLRGTVGVCGVLLVVLMLLPTLVKLFLLRLTWQIAASIADLLGCEREKKLLEEFASILGYLIAAVSICSSVLLLALILLACCGTAVG